MSNILQKIQENLTGAVSGFKGELISSFVRSKTDQNDITGRLGNFNKKLKYRFQIIDNSSNLFDETNDFFELQLNPQEIDQEEPFAIQVTPTQQGIIAEHQGSVLKQLVISGTTGLHPNAGSAGVNNNGRYRFGRGQTGYEQFHNFRNYIRRYAELKKDPGNRGKQLVFENIKDNEFFVVEPKIFKMKRSKSNPFGYDYNISFVIVGRLQTNRTTDNLGWFESLQQASRDATNYIQDAEGIISGSVQLLSTVSDNFTDLVLNPLRALNQALIAFNGGKTRVLDIPRREVNQLSNNIKQLKTNLAESVGIDTSSYNALQGRTGTTSSIRSEATIQDYRLINSLADALRGANIILSNNEFFGKTSLLDIAQETIEQYDGNLSIQNSTAVRIRKVLKGDTVQTIAARELGTAKRFREIIILNNLKYPYINETPKKNVLIPGDDVLIPIQQSQNQEILIFDNNNSPLTQSLTFSQQQLGIDLQVDKNYDLILTNLNDYKLVSSHDNAAQAVRIKLGLEKGSLKYHPEIGITSQIGEKLTSENIFRLQESMKNSVLIDPRFDQANFDITAKQTIIEIVGYVKEKAFDLSTPINLLISRNV